MGVAVEVEGLTSWGKNRDGSMRLGRHQSARGYAADCEKYAAALVEGWRVLRVTGAMVTDGRAVAWTEELLSAPSSSRPD